MSQLLFGTCDNTDVKPATAAPASDAAAKLPGVSCSAPTGGNTIGDRGGGTGPGPGALGTCGVTISGGSGSIGSGGALWPNPGMGSVGGAGTGRAGGAGTGIGRGATGGSIGRNCAGTARPSPPSRGRNVPPWASVECAGQRGWSAGVHLSS